MMTRRSAPVYQWVMTLWRQVGLLVAVLCLAFSGCGSVAEASDSSQPAVGGVSTMTPSNSPQPTGGGDLTGIDWANMTYPDVCKIGSGGTVTVVNGIATGQNGISLRIADPLFGFVTRTTQIDAIIPYECTGANGFGRHVLVFAGDALSPQLVGQLPLVASPILLSSVFTEGIGAHKLELSGVGYSSSSVPHCCPDVWVQDTYRWNGTTFVLDGHQAQKLGQLLTP